MVSRIDRRFAALPLSPRGRGREAMIYGRVLLTNLRHNVMGASVSHSAELERDDLLASVKAPSPGPADHLLPKGRRGIGTRRGEAA
jgi:hypothetical protein